VQRPRKNISIERIQKIRDQIYGLQGLRWSDPAFKKWHRDACVAVTNTFGDSSNHICDFDAIQYSLRGLSSLTTDRDFQEAYEDGLRTAEAVLNSMIDEIEEYWEDASTGTTPATTGEQSQEVVTNEIFLIHGRDIGARETVARFLDTLGIKATILQEQPDESQTIIEKFERYTEVDFALALFTPDDVGGLEDNALKPRSRQNVIFEFGYFIGKYGRNRVRALVKGNIEIPSDYSGVLYIQFDESGRWKMDLIRELKSAGFEIDANRAFE